MRTTSEIQYSNGEMLVFQQPIVQRGHTKGLYTLLPGSLTSTLIFLFVLTLFVLLKTLLNLIQLCGKLDYIFSKMSSYCGNLI